MKHAKVDNQQGAIIHALINMKSGEGFQSMAPVDQLKAHKVLSRYISQGRENRLEKERRAKHQQHLKDLFEATANLDILKHGFFSMVVWQRDCDMCESTELVRFKSIKDLEETKKGAVEWAEGPVTWNYISPEDAESFRGQFRDLVMEDRENGGDGYHLTNLTR